MSDDPTLLIHDWNATPGAGGPAYGSFSLLDDTLRDGLQNAAARQPTFDEKLELLELMAEIGVACVNLGLPASSPRARDEVERLVGHIARSGLPLGVAVAGRTLDSDVQAILELSQRTGFALEGHAFVGSSAIRWAAEGWDLAEVRRRTEAAIGLLARAGIAATFVTEDTTRSHPQVLRALFRTALDAGAVRLCLCDTVGHATPGGAQRLVGFARALLVEWGAEAELDWHGHNDRGLGLPNALSALEAGASRVHATALGVGERVGNVPMELLVLNLVLDGRRPAPARLLAYAERASELLGCPVPSNYPLVGENAFRTATGVHAAAILKARAKSAWIADRVYSAVPASEFGRAHEIRVGAMSGASNVRHWLEKRGIAASDALVGAVLERARASGRVLEDEELAIAVEEALAGRPR